MKLIIKRIYQIHIVLKYYIVLIISPFFYVAQKNTWLISERGDEARDNGLYFYNYLKQTQKNIKIKYVITKNSKDIDAIAPKDRVYLRTTKHYLYFINSKFLISTHNMGCSPRFAIFTILDEKNMLFVHGKRIFLQHGVVYNYNKTLANKKIDLFITSSPKEQEYVINNFGYSKKIVKCTGLARFDYFNLPQKEIILVMPTWRRNLKQMSVEQFITTNYYKQWNSLFNNEKIIKLLEKNKINLLFYPHYEMQKYIDSFSTKSKNVVFAKAENYSIHDLLNECKAFITDYSSTAFDVAYLEKPILYYNFDYDEFYSEHSSKGYMDLKTNGLGIYTNNATELCEELEKIVNSNFLLNKEISDRINSFYKYNDKKNCERIYKEIRKLETKTTK